MSYKVAASLLSLWLVVFLSSEAFLVSLTVTGGLLIFVFPQHVALGLLKLEAMMMLNMGLLSLLCVSPGPVAQMFSIFVIAVFEAAFGLSLLVKSSRKSRKSESLLV